MGVQQHAEPLPEVGVAAAGAVEKGLTGPVVCQVEAMKLFNEITADCTGTVAEVCVKNVDFVEYNQVLFRVEPS